MNKKVKMKYSTTEELKNDVKLLFQENKVLVPLDRILPPNANINSPHSINYNPEYLFLVRYEEMLYVLHQRYNWIIQKTDAENLQLSVIRNELKKIGIKKTEIWREWNELMKT